jgi:AcrR family transcriptional regulator
MNPTPKYSRLDPARRREQILDAANALFSERGYDTVSVEDIASSAGVTRGLVHHYFGGRKQVYIALLQQLGAVREQQLPPPVGRSARARLADSVSRWLDWTEANRTIWLATIARGDDIADPAKNRERGGIFLKAWAQIVMRIGTPVTGSSPAPIVRARPLRRRSAVQSAA